jgi:hypothetical protein
MFLNIKIMLSEFIAHLELLRFKLIPLEYNNIRMILRFLKLLFCGFFVYYSLCETAAHALIVTEALNNNNVKYYYIKAKEFKNLWTLFLNTYLIVKVLEFVFEGYVVISNKELFFNINIVVFLLVILLLKIIFVCTLFLIWVYYIKSLFFELFLFL